MTNRISRVGNINKENIEINEEKGFAKFSVAVSQGKDQEPQWYNLTHFINKDGADPVLEDLKFRADTFSNIPFYYFTEVNLKLEDLGFYSL